MKARQSKIKRHTKETRISIRLNLDGKGKAKIHTGLPFFDHMLTLFAKHATVDLELRCDGDLEVDAHHTARTAASHSVRPSPPRSATNAVSVVTGGLRHSHRERKTWPHRKVLKPMCRWTNVSPDV